MILLPEILRQLFYRYTKKSKSLVNQVFVGEKLQQTVLNVTKTQEWLSVYEGV